MSKTIFQTLKLFPMQNHIETLLLKKTRYTEKRQRKKTKTIKVVEPKENDD